MTKTEELFDDAISLPADVRMQLVDTLLQSLNPRQEEIDPLWAKEAEKRVDEIRMAR